MYCARVVEGLLIQDRCLITEECRYMNLISLDAPGLRIGNSTFSRVMLSRAARRPKSEATRGIWRSDTLNHTIMVAERSVHCARVPRPIERCAVAPPSPATLLRTRLAGWRSS